MSVSLYVCHQAFSDILSALKKPCQNVTSDTTKRFQVISDSTKRFFSFGKKRPTISWPMPVPRPPPYLLYTANGLFGDKSCKFRHEFLAAARKHYAAELAQHDFRLRPPSLLPFVYIERSYVT